jgi:hypothetical protein
MLLVNVAANNNHWLGVITMGTKSNRDGIGAQVTVFSGDHKWMQEVRSGSSYISSSDLRLHFGLGPASAINRITVRWPSGLHEVFQFTGQNRAVDRFVTLVEGKGQSE